MTLGWRPAWARPALLLLALLALPLAAHQQKEAVTRILFNDRTGNIEVMHRFLLHDAEHATRELFGKSADLLGSSADQARFAAYVHERFLLLDQDGERIPLVAVGQEVEGRFLWVYAEAPIPPAITGLTLSQEALRELWPDQVNLVNVERDGSVKSALFDGSSQDISISLSGP